MTPRLKTVYQEKIVPDLIKKFSYKNVMQVPKIEKIVLNMGLGKVTEGGKNNKIIEEAVEELATIVGQMPVITKAKKSIAGFIEVRLVLDNTLKARQSIMRAGNFPGKQEPKRR